MDNIHCILTLNILEYVAYFRSQHKISLLTTEKKEIDSNIIYRTTFVNQHQNTSIPIPFADLALHSQKWSRLI